MLGCNNQKKVIDLFINLYPMNKVNKKVNNLMQCCNIF